MKDNVTSDNKESSVPCVAQVDSSNSVEQGGSYYYELFKFFSDSHNLTLLDSEIEEIISAVEKFEEGKRIEAQSEADRQLEEDGMNYEMFSTEDLINCLPQNRPLYKDSGLWQIRTDDMQDVMYQQRVGESLRAFIIRYIEWLEGLNDEDIEQIQIDLALTL